MLHVVGIRSKTEIVRVFKVCDLIEPAQCFIPIAESYGVWRRDTIGSSEDEFAPADRRNAAGTRRPVQLLQHCHAALDVAEDRLQPFFRSANPFDQKGFFEFPLLFELPHKRGCLPIEFHHWCHRIPLFMAMPTPSMPHMETLEEISKRGALLTPRKLVMDNG